MIMLNKHGWGLKEMLVLSGILLLFLIIAIYYISTLYQDLDLEATSDYYYDLEQDLENSVSVYLRDYYDGNLGADEITITRSTLRAYDLDVDLEDQNHHVCSGYAVASKTHGVETIEAYISCPNYTTNGYESWRTE